MADLLACLDDPALALLQWTEAFNVVQARHICLRHQCMLRWFAEGAADPNLPALAHRLENPHVPCGALAFSLPAFIRCCYCVQGIDMMTCSVSDILTGAMSADTAAGGAGVDAGEHCQRVRGGSASRAGRQRQRGGCGRLGPLPRPPASGGHQLRHPGVSQPPDLVVLLYCCMHMPMCTSRYKQQWCCHERMVFAAHARLARFGLRPANFTVGRTTGNLLYRE